MTGSVLFGLTFAAALGSGLMAGLFFVFSTFMMTALGRLPAAQGIAAMQSVNIVIINPPFLSVFFGTALVCAVLAVAAILRWSDPGSAWLLFGSLSYLLGIIVVTMVFNVPLNNALAAVTPDSAAAGELWTRYLSVWTSWNHVRTVGGLAALASLIMALR
jgi:uncharacterized membrane protein